MGSTVGEPTPEFWENCYQDGHTPWDAGSVPQALKDYMAKTALSGRVLIPGCGSGHEIPFFAEVGFEVNAIDISQSAVNIARRKVQTQPATISLGDFFSFDFGGKPFDIVYERTFLCSLPRRLWDQYVTRMADLLQQGGRLIGFFLFWDTGEGPPYGLKNQEQIDSLLRCEFTLIENAAVNDSIPFFAGKERWQVWERL